MTPSDEPDSPLPDEGVDGVAAMIEDAQSSETMADELRLASAADPLPGLPLNGVAAGGWTPDELGLPDDCPVIPLGTKEGNFFFLNTIGELRQLNETSLGQKTINSLFMRRHHYLYWAWPKYNKAEKIVGFRAEKATEDLIGACATRGPFDLVAQTRGRGAWQGPNGELILHCGNTLIENGKQSSLGVIGGRVYPTRPPILTPWPKPLTEKPGPALELLKLLRTWHWDRPELDPILLMGAIGAAMIGGALEHRPSIFLVGDKATGKSTLQQILRYLFGRMLIQTADTTAAGIYQQLQFDSLPVAVDEFEAKADPRRAKAILELARAAYSGDVMMRGGDQHKGIQFNARSSFIFSAINTPPLDPQDYSRMAILSLKPLDLAAPPPDIDPEKFRRLGRMCLRRMIDNWHRFPATLLAYAQAMRDAGHGGRGQNTYGTLLACADLLIDHDAIALDVPMAANAEKLDYWTERLNPQHMIEFEGDEDNWRKCLNYILSARIDAWRGGARSTVGKVLHDFWTGDYNAPSFADGEESLSFSKARDLLQETGLSLQKPSAKDVDYQLFIPNNNPLLYQLYMGSKWQGTPEAGSWMTALRQATTGTYQVGSGRVNGVKCKGTLFNLRDIMGTDTEGEGGETEDS